MKHNLKIVVNLKTLLSLLSINHLINLIHFHFRSVLPAADVMTVLLHCYPCYSYGISKPRQNLSLAMVF
jgi:hypothetical protein